MDSTCAWRLSEPDFTSELSSDGTWSRCRGCGQPYDSSRHSWPLAQAAPRPRSGTHPHASTAVLQCATHFRHSAVDQNNSLNFRISECRFEEQFLGTGSRSSLCHPRPILQSPSPVVRGRKQSVKDTYNAAPRQDPCCTWPSLKIQPV